MQADRPSPGGFVCVGQVCAPHGLHGAVRVSSATEDPEALLAFSQFYGASTQPLLGPGRLLFSEGPRTFVLKFGEIPDRTAAEALKGQFLYVPRADLPEALEETFYYADLIGLPVRGADQKSLGTLLSIQNFGAGDLLEIQPLDGSQDSFYLPFRKEYVPTVCLPKDGVEGFLIIDPPVWRDGDD